MTQDGLLMEVESLRRRLAAADRTIKVLSDRAESSMDVTGSTFQLLEKNVAVERVVVARTRAISEANEKLSEALRVAHRWQAEAHSAQRLATAGTLAAGVAHEINTPVQFVSDSIHFLTDAMGELSSFVSYVRGVLKEIQTGMSDEQLTVLRSEVVEMEESSDLDYVMENVPKALERCVDGLQRVSSIVRSLKEFAHPAQEFMAPADLNHAVENTLTIARNEYKYVADVEVDLQPIPLVTCCVGDINQVILNLLVNAAHAIGDAIASTERRGRIRIRSYEEDEHVVIEVADDGTGIPEAVRPRIFEPFFTTKKVGKGTGQGLPLSWAMVTDKHGGRLDFVTKVGEGTTFFVRLPISRHDSVVTEEAVL
ncbi:MAG: hypothetical protein IPK13_25165 [Deltaproteobacteria bacterium]|nr:hypothetical protein [Deltaproteobacteria bacterium]